MGVKCEIRLDKPTDGVYKPGSNVKGYVKYSISKDTIFKEITISLKGKSKNMWKDKRKRGGSKYNRTGEEEVIAMQKDILTNPIGAVMAGEYTASFEFTLPLKIPPSYKYVGRRCKAFITYAVKLKFAEPGVFSLAKRFRSEITVANLISPTLPMEPMMYGMNKNIQKWYGADDGDVNLKATIAKSVLTPGEIIALNLEIQNNTARSYVQIRTALYEDITLTDNSGRSKIITQELKGCNAKTHKIASNNSVSLTNTVPTPRHVFTIQGSSIISRDYKLLLKIRRPGLCRDACLEIPVVIGELTPVVQIRSNTSNYAYDNPSSTTDDNRSIQPPSYWEVMTEDREAQRKF